ncbi:hypothetical protein ACFFOP_07070 [Sinosporangium siamense]
MIARKNVVIPAIAATLVTTWVYTGSPIAGMQSMFNASLAAASELFNIFLIIALMTGLLGALQSMGADRRMVEPLHPVMRNGGSAFWVIALATYVIGLFFWPTPAAALVGGVLLPVAIRAGLSPMAAAFGMSIAGQGMALSSDYVIQVAPGLSAKAAGVSTTAVADRALVLSLVTGVLALVIGYFLLRKTFTAPSAENFTQWEKRAQTISEDEESNGTIQTAPQRTTTSKVFAVVVPVAFALLMGYMLLGKFTDLVPEAIGGSASALIGGLALLLLIAASVGADRLGGLESSAKHFVDGLLFSVKAMGAVVPIAGFFFIGNPELAGRIFGLEEGSQAPRFLFDLAERSQDIIPQTPFFAAFTLLIIGMLAGIDGAGFVGLPLTGSVAGSLGLAVDTDPALLAAVGQMGSVWVGGGTLIAWSSLLAVAAIARVSVLDLARLSFIPVVIGLIVSTIVGTIIF